MGNILMNIGMSKVDFEGKYVETFPKTQLQRHTMLLCTFKDLQEYDVISCGISRSQ